MKLRLEHINQIDETEFIKLLGGIFEHSPWVAESAFKARPFQTLTGLHTSMVATVMNTPLAQQLELIRAHPDLAGKAARAGKLTTSSSKEQAGAGLASLSDKEYDNFHLLNNAYKAKFEFPFILAVKGHTKQSILEAFRTRLTHSTDEELETALEQIAQIAKFRLEDLFDG